MVSFSIFLILYALYPANLLYISQALDEKTMCVDGAGKTMAGGESWLADDGCNKGS